MRIHDEDGDKVIDRVTLFLLMDEAIQLRASLDVLISNPVLNHEHISSADYDREITICVYGPDKLTFDLANKLPPLCLESN